MKPETKPRRADEQWSLGSPAAVFGGVFLLAVLSHLTALGNRFVYDDIPELLTNPVIQRPFDLRAVLTAQYWGGGEAWHATGFYRPFLTLVQKLVYDGFGPNPLPFHLLVILVHGATAGLLGWFLAARAKVPTGAWVAASLFAVHPALAEATATGYGLKETLPALLAMSALAVHSGWRPDRPAVRLVRLSVAGALICASLFSKETSAPFFLALTGWDLFAPGGAGPPQGLRARIRPALFHSAFYASIVLASVIARVPILGGILAPIKILAVDNPIVELSPPWGFATALEMTARYARLLVLPYGTTPNYGAETIPVATSLLAPSVLAGAVAAALLLLAALLAWRLPPPAAIGALIAAPVWLLQSNLLVVFGTIGSERFLYMPALGLAMLLAAGVDRVRVSAKARPLLTIVPVVVLGFGIWTLLRCPVYRDEESLGRSGLAAAPRNAILLRWVANVEIEAGRPSAAEPLLRRAREIRPDTPFVEDLLARVLIETGRFEEGLGVYLSAVDQPEADINTFRICAQTLSQAGRDREAVSVLSRGLAKGRGSPAALAQARHLRGVLLLGLGKERQGFADLEVARGLDPSNLRVREDLAGWLARAGRPAEARAVFESVLTLDPSRTHSMLGLGAIELAAGRTEEALVWFRRAAAADPHDREPPLRLASALLRKGDRDGARGAFLEVLEIDRADPIALASLARLDAEAGRSGEAHRWCTALFSLPRLDERLAAEMRPLCGSLPDGR